jgi:membrane protease YdiL (CAAX protease family)
MTATNDDAALRCRRDAGTLTWSGPALMLFARSACAVAAQALVAAIFALRSSPTPWHDSEPWVILGGIYATGWLVYGTLTGPYIPGSLPLPAAVYGVLVFPFVWGLTEQMTYNGYLVPRFRVLFRSTSLAVALVAFVWSFQHVVMPLTFDAKYMVFRLLSPIPFSVFQTLLYLRLRRLVPFAIAHAIMDGASVLIGVLPQSRA